MQRDPLEGLCIGPCLLSHFSLPDCETLWTVDCQALLSMGFSREENWSGLPCLPLGNLSDPGIESVSPASPAMHVYSLLMNHQGSPKGNLGIHMNPRDSGAWWAAVYGVAQSRTRLKRLSSLATS